MSRLRRKLTAEFKTRVALDALSGEQTLSELAGWYGVHPNQISRWKQQAKETDCGGFAGKSQKAKKSDEGRIKELHAKIGQLPWKRIFYSKPSPKSEP